MQLLPTNRKQAHTRWYSVGMTTQVNPSFRTRSARPARRGKFSLVATLIIVVLVYSTSGCNRAETPADLPAIRTLLEQGRYGDAIEPLRTFLSESPNDAEANFLYAVALIRTGELGAAKWALRKAAEHPEWTHRASMELASIAIRTHEYPDAIAMLDEILESEEKYPLARFMRGEAYLSMGKSADKAIEDFDILLQDTPDSFSVRVSRAAALLLEDRVEEAEEAIKVLSTEVNTDEEDRQSRARLCAIRATLQFERERRDEALKILDGCLENFSGEYVTVSSALHIFDTMGAPERAIEVLESSLALEPRAHNVRESLAARLIAEGEPDRGESILREGTEIGSKSSRAAIWTALTNFYLMIRNDLPAAIGAYEQALANSDDPPVLAVLTYGDLLARAGENEKALEVAAGIKNGTYRGLIEARVHLNRLQPARALARLDEVLPIWPNNAGARYYAARAAEQLGNFPRAVEEYRQSIRSGSDQTDAALRLAKFYLAAGSDENAWAIASQYFTSHPNDAEGVRVLIRSARGSDDRQITNLFQRLRPTPLWAIAVATRADSVAEARNHQAALAVLGETVGLDLTLPRHAPILRSWVVHLAAAGRTLEAREKVDTAFAPDTRVATFHEIHGVLLEAEGAPPDRVLEAYERAIELDPGHPRALEALGRLAANRSDTDTALAYLGRAIEAEIERPSPARRAASLEAAAGKPLEAEKRLEGLLREHPWDSPAARDLAHLRVDRAALDERTQDLAERAAFFGGDPSDQQFLLEVLRARGESERASELEELFGQGTSPSSPSSASDLVPNRKDSGSD